MRDFSDIIINHCIKTHGESVDDLQLLLAKELFNSHNYFDKDVEWLEFTKKLTKKQLENLIVLTHFYYYIYKESSIVYKQTRDELLLISSCSIIEKLMSQHKYVDFFQWFDSQESSVSHKIIINKSLNDTISNLKKEYHKKYGCTKKIEKFFSDYLNNENQKLLLESIKKYNYKKNDFEKLDNIENVAKVIYQMRSDFVHNGRMRVFCPDDCSVFSTKIGKKYFDLKLKRLQYEKVFENGFINYFRECINKTPKIRN